MMNQERRQDFNYYQRNNEGRFNQNQRQLPPPQFQNNRQTHDNFRPKPQYNQYEGQNEFYQDKRYYVDNHMEKGHHQNKNWNYKNNQRNQNGKQNFRNSAYTDNYQKPKYDEKFVNYQF